MTNKKIDLPYNVMKINEHEISLNSQQATAVMHEQGPLLVIAGAGSGKTRVITARIAHLITHHKVHASSIIALTFTNKAAHEMKERITTFIGANQELPFVGTFHAYCLRLLKSNQHLTDTPFMTILDEDDQKKLLHDILKRSNMLTQLAPRQAAYHISQMKNKNIQLDTPTHHLFDHPLMPDIYHAYETEKRASKALDFDDLLLETVRLFKKAPSFKESFQALIRHILVDEYQDTNIVQHELLRQMALQGKKVILDSICAVGDEDQSIYSWRGANVTNMLNFQKDFPTTTLIKIEQNYRSVQPILDTANQIIQHNIQRNPKKLWSERKASNRIKLLTCLSEYQEADGITQFITAIHRYKVTNEIAVLYRTHAQSRALEESFLKHAIAYKIIGGIQFYERKEIKDLFAYLKLIVNPFDRASLFRIINTPTRGFGDKFEQQLYTILKEQPFIPFYTACATLRTQLPPAKQRSLDEFIAIFAGLTAQDMPSHALQSIIERTSYLSFIKKEYERDEAQSRIENIQELFDAIKHFEAQKITTITAFLDEVALMQEKLAATDDNQHKVVLMTLHAAKGLEFDTVIIAGLEQGVLPTARALHEDPAALEEERRLLYVGITRAKERLMITNTKFRYTYGQMSEQIPSQFLDELPSKFITKEDCAYWNNARFAAYFADWLNPFYNSPDKQEKNTPNTFVAFIKNKIVAKLPKASTPENNTFKKNQPVHHKKYGTGIVQHIETSSDSTVITVKFKDGIKKIVASFLERI